MMIPLRQMAAILIKDLTIERRSKDIVLTMLVFALMVVIVFNFIFDPGSETIRSSAPGILWVTIIFAGNLGLSRSFAKEHEQGMMQGLLLCPIDRSLIYIAKVIGNVIFITLVQCVILPIMIVLFDLSVVDRLAPLASVLFLGSIGFASVGTLFSTISANTRAREVMLPILLFPISVPVILAATKSTAALLSAKTMGETGTWIRLLIIFDVIFTVICFLLYEYVLEE